MPSFAPSSVREKASATQRARPWVMDTPFGSAGTGSVTFRPTDGAEIASLPAALRSSLWIVVAVVTVFALISIGFTLFLGWISP